MQGVGGSSPLSPTSSCCSEERLAILRGVFVFPMGVADWLELGNASFVQEGEGWIRRGQSGVAEGNSRWVQGDV